MFNLQDVVASALWERYHKKSLIAFYGDLEAKAFEIGWPGNVGPASLVFLQSEEFTRECLTKGFAIGVADQKVADLFATEFAALKKSAVLVAQHTKQSQQEILTDLVKPLSAFEKQPFWISPQAKIGANVQVGAFASVHQNAVIGDGVHLGDHCVVEEGAIIGAGSTLAAGVFIGKFCRIGKNCTIHANTVIGADGFGYIPAPVPKKIPQIGVAIIEDEVEIGALCTIDRAVLGETRIGYGTKMDNHCHIAHNCTIGKGCLMATGFWMSGSSSLGDYSYASGGVHILDHISICGRVMLGGRSGVSKNITEPGSYTGYPLQKVQDSLKTTQNIRNLTEMRKRLHRLEKEIAQLKDSHEL